MSEPYVSDSDFTLYVGDVRDVLAGLPDGSVDCVVTSPPYWGLRDYGTGVWAGGDAGCDHKKDAVKNRGEDFRQRGEDKGYAKGSNFANYGDRNATGSDFESTCGKCGATRVDQQIGLEPTPEAYVEQMVAVFRQVRRVLADHGSLWLNLGDSYANKQRQMMPARVALALQADGWWLRSEIVWFKSNPMPASVTDRPTDAHEMVYLLSKQPRYFFDQEAVREPHSPDGRLKTVHDHATPASHPNYDNVGNGNERWPNSGRNVRSVWEIATQPYPEAHFATFPEALAERCIKAGCPEWVCGTCGKARVRIVERQNESAYARIKREHGITYQDMKAEAAANGITPGNVGGTHAPGQRGAQLDPRQNLTVGWSDCGHDNYRPGRVLDPFMGSGTVALVARNQRRHSIGVELNEEYARLCAKRLQQLSLLAEGTM